MDLARLRRDPLWTLTLIALAPRLLAAIFSAGYFAHDDHFLVIEPAASWVEAADYNSWLPWNQGRDAVPSGHSFVYVGLHYLLFRLLALLGSSDPEVNMVVVRVLHAFWSVVVVRTGHRIAERIAGADAAWRTGLLLALLYFMPFLAVRNLVEVACIPFLMLGAWQLVKDDIPTPRALLLAGIWIGLAINIRYQAIFFAAGPGLVLLGRRRWTDALRYGSGVLLPLVVLQGGIDLAIWGRPFAEMGEYVRYNLANTTTYFDQPWYNYLLLLAGIYIPPLSVAVLFGLLWRPRPVMLWVPVMLFLAFHSWFPNKQERFLLPIVPLALILGYTAWDAFRGASSWWRARPGLWRGALRFTWSVNILLLAVLTFTTSKRSRVEAMLALRNGPEVRGMVVDDSVEHDPPWMPMYYLGMWQATQLPYADPTEDLAREFARMRPEERPDVVLFIGEEQLGVRQARMMELMGPLETVAIARPGLVDRVVHWLNPVNRNETITVMRQASEGPPVSSHTPTNP